jgi:hypothetical protein
MNRSYPFVEIHYALWAVLSVPIGFAGMFFLIPGLILQWGLLLLAVSGLLVFYVSRLTRHQRAAWLLGLALHAALLVAAIYYIPRWPPLLGVPLALANVYSLFVLLVYRGLWTTTGPMAQEALA